jgi:predicted nucleic acid-binding Zn ribbon protein
MPRPRRPPQLVGDALHHLLQRIDPDRRLAVFRIWKSEVGAALAARAAPTGFRDGVLSVRVEGAAWMQELQFAVEEIRARLNARLGADIVRDIYFVAGSSSAVPPTPPAAPPRGDPVAVEEPIELPPLRDARLAEVFARIARAHRRRGRRDA